MQYLFLFIVFRMASPNTSKPPKAPKVPLPREQRPPRPEFWPEPPVPPPEPPEDSEEEEIMCDMIKLNPLEMSNQEYIREKENKILKH